MTGYYSPYPMSVQLLEKHMFCTLDNFKNFVNIHVQLYSFHISKSYRDTVRTKFLSLRTKAPFSRTIRFPDSFYIDMDCAKISTVTKQFLNALLLFDLWEDNNLRKQNGICANVTEYINNVTDANFAFAKFADIMNTDINHLEENGIYCRTFFEEQYGVMRWCPEGE